MSHAPVKSSLVSATALIVDDEPDICELLSLTLSRMGIECHTAGSLARARALLTEHRYQLCLTDMRLPDGNGIELVRAMQQRLPDLPIAVITAHGNMDTAIEAMKAGAFDFLSKPVDLNSLRQLVSQAIQAQRLGEATSTAEAPRLIGESAPIRALKQRIGKLARSQAPVYISGPSGSGKELVAHSIHESGPRARAPFVPVNCGAIPKELMESEFFGHRKGSFTGAHQDKQGLFQAADGGTLFLDEVADLPLEMQVKLLRALQEKAVRPVGASGEIATDVRVLSATHKDLAEAVAAGTFRQDLYYRLNVIQLEVPPLSERPDDLPLLAQHLLARLAEELQLPPPRLGKDALAALAGYDFPGNVRELENILERAFTLCENDTIAAADLQLGAATERAPERVRAAGGTAHASNYADRCREFPSLDDYLAEVEREVLVDMLETTRWNKTLAAKELGITFRSLRYRLHKLGLDSD